MEAEKYRLSLKVHEIRMRTVIYRELFEFIGSILQ